MGKLFLSVLWIALFGIELCCAEEFPLNKISDWTPYKRTVQSSDNTIRVIGKQLLFSAQTYPYDSGKAYRILGEFKAAPGTKANYFSVGIQPLDADKEPLSYHNVRTLAGSDTKLIADVKATDTVIMIADGSKWRVNNSDVVAFHTDPQGKDLPNRNIIQLSPIKIQQKLAGWEVLFGKPVGVDLKSSTGVRLHPTGGNYRYAGYGSSAKGVMNPNCSTNLWDIGVKYFRVVVVANSEPLTSGDLRPELEMKDVRLEVSDLDNGSEIK